MQRFFNNKSLWTGKAFKLPQTSTLNFRNLHSDYKSRNKYNKTFYYILGGSIAAYNIFKKKEKEEAKCCGIVAYLGQADAHEVLCEGIKILQNRGYDSCGITTITEDSCLITTKFASKGTTNDCIDMLFDHAPLNHAGHMIGIGHTRWATHGGKTDANAHPHLDYQSRIAIVHNGQIDNYDQLKTKLIKKGISFKSDTDTEVIGNLIASFLDQEYNFLDAVNNAVNQLEGTWGIAVIHKDLPDRIILARNGSPLLVGQNGNEIIVASEQLALSRRTNQFIQLADGEVMVVTNVVLQQMTRTRTIHVIQNKLDELTPDPYKHWTIKEIMEQPTTMNKAMNMGGRIESSTRVKLGGLESNIEDLKLIKDLVIIACGTSYYAGMFGEILLTEMQIFEYTKLYDASEVKAHIFNNKKKAGLLSISQSGETLDVIKACNLTKGYNVKHFSIVNVVGSHLARLSNVGVYIHAGREVAVASTKAFTSQIIVLSLVAIWFSQLTNSNEKLRQDLIDHLRRLPMMTQHVLDNHELLDPLAEAICGSTSIFILGKGYSYPAALESALKIKEISYIHAEGYAGGALKHGPFALIDELNRTPVILLIFNDEEETYMMSTLQQVKARGAYVITITNIPERVVNYSDFVFEVNYCGTYTSVLAVVALQLLAYKMSVLKKINPDNPRGLAKTVTVF